MKGIILELIYKTMSGYENSSFSTGLTVHVIDLNFKLERETQLLPDFNIHTLFSQKVVLMNNKYFTHFNICQTFSQRNR